MFIIGALLVIMVISSALVLSACMLASKRSQKLEQGDGLSVELSGRWSGANFGGKYTSKAPFCSFE
ncbi:MAG: hypothetical protein ACK2UH_02870, partial [Candidatus Promineifilaceae bacterium]